jgi:hypothetical protein
LLQSMGCCNVLGLVPVPVPLLLLLHGV